MSPSPDARETGSYLREVRESAGVSQAELARRLGSHQPAIARLEAGQAQVNMRTLERIAEALGLEIEWEMVSRDQAFGDGVSGRMQRKQ
jgi:transcriptional regulator with XRE-family HTH domain